MTCVQFSSEYEEWEEEETATSRSELPKRGQHTSRSRSGPGSDVTTDASGTSYWEEEEEEEYEEEEELADQQPVWCPLANSVFCALLS